MARAQQPAMPVIGYLSERSSESDMAMLVAVRRGLEEVSYVEGRNVAIEYRFADGQIDRVPALGMELAGRRVAMIVCVGSIDKDEVVRWPYPDGSLKDRRRHKGLPNSNRFCHGRRSSSLRPRFELQSPGRESDRHEQLHSGADD
jgi:hypothetical protein